MISYLDLFITLFVFRYTRLAGNLYAFCRLRPVPVPENPTLTSKDVTVVIPTIEGSCAELWNTVDSVLKTHPFEIIVVTIDSHVEKARSIVKQMPTTKIRILSIDHPNKRFQMVRAIPDIKTDVTIFADDDVTWPTRLLPWMLAPLEDENCGGVGTNQRLRRAEAPNIRQRIWGYLGALYLERRNFDCAACMYMDGGLPCLSGRTVAYRTQMLRDIAFRDAFTHEEWLGRYRLAADDDNFITRWLISHGKKIMFQYHKEAEVQTTLEDNSMFLRQCLRWLRSNWRSNITSLFCEPYIWRRQLWSTYAVLQTTFTHWAVLWDCLLIYLCFHSGHSWDDELRWTFLGLVVTWMLLSKFIKLLGHYIRYPADFLLLPISILFGYGHGLCKIYALLTLNVTAWGSREGADTNDASRMIPVTQTEKE